MCQGDRLFITHLEEKIERMEQTIEAYEKLLYYDNPYRQKAVEILMFFIKKKEERFIKKINKKYLMTYEEREKFLRGFVNDNR